MRYRFFFWGFTALAMTACSTDRNAIVKTGALVRGTLSVTAAHGKIEAYPPANGEPKEKYTFEVLPRGGGVPVVNDVAGTKGHDFATAGGAADVLVRVPQGVHAALIARDGDVHVSDVNAPVDAVATNGNIKIQIPSYANAHTTSGNISATIGDVNWPGTLHFSAQSGDVEVWVPAVANASVDLHTDRGTIFTDFNLHGSAKGQAESIAGTIGSGGSRAIVVRVKTGNIRLLKLVPQM